MRRMAWCGAVCLCSALFVSGIVNAQDKPKHEAKPEAKAGGEHKMAEGGKDAKQAEDMAKMMELSKLNENHKLLEGMVGEWTYTCKFWETPGGAPQESTGTTVSKSLFGGRYVQSEHTGKFQMPGADGKMTEMEFKGIGLYGYDNAKKKFVNTWIDNMGTGFMTAEGTYEPGTKTFTYTGTNECMPGQPAPFREVVKVTDKDHHTFEYYETRDGKEMKMMEINYTRKSAR